MKYEIRKVDKEKGIVQITTTDERWYQHGDNFYPSSTWIADFYPKGVAYFKWLASLGWNEAEAIKKSAGDRGKKVHKACESLIKGKELKMDDKYFSELTEKEEELTPEEWHCIMTFKEWYEEFKPDKIIACEASGVNTKIGYGGTIDLALEKDGKVYLIDLKTSANIWPSHRLQVSSYKQLLPYIENTKHIELSGVGLYILQLGYTRNKHKQYKLTEVEDKFDLFLNAKAIWEEEVNQKQPPQREYPLTIKL
jgi:hypothetical protein